MYETLAGREFDTIDTVALMLLEALNERSIELVLSSSLSEYME
jgi:hypothetical protein